MPELLAEITLPWPDKVLSPNSKNKNWGARQYAKSTAREYAAFTAWEVLFDATESKKSLTIERIHAWIVFNPPNKRRRDLDNLLATMKPDIDGVCLGLKIDDSQIKRITLDWGDVDTKRKTGSVIIRLYEFNEVSHDKAQGEWNDKND